MDYLWIIVMFLSAVWTLILTAPIHCRASIAETVMQCYISPSFLIDACVLWEGLLTQLALFLLLATFSKVAPGSELLKRQLRSLTLQLIHTVHGHTLHAVTAASPDRVILGARDSDNGDHLQHHHHHHHHHHCTNLY